MISLKKQRTHHYQFLLLTVRTCSIADNLAKPTGMVSLLPFDMQIRGAAILILLHFAFSLWKTQQVLHVLPVLVPLAASGCTMAADGLMGLGPREEKVLLPATGRRQRLVPRDPGPGFAGSGLGSLAASGC